jgi:hypothetical protein
MQKGLIKFLRLLSTKIVLLSLSILPLNICASYWIILLKKDPLNRKVFLLDSPLLTFTAKTYFMKTFSELNFGTKTSLRIRFQRLCQQIWKSVTFYIYFP